MYNVISFWLIALFFLGCTKPIKIINKDQIVKEKVMVKCSIPKIDCEFSGENFEPTKKLLACVIKQKKAIELCTKD